MLKCKCGSEEFEAAIVVSQPIIINADGEYLRDDPDAEGGALLEHDPPYYCHCCGCEAKGTEDD